MLTTRVSRRRAYGALGLIAVVTALVLWSRLGPSPGPPPVPPPKPMRLDGEALPQSFTGRVVSVVAGDTIDVQLDGQQVRVRYIGVNTPETKHPTEGQEPCGPEASAANRRLVEGQTVRLELDVQAWDRSQRLLAYVYVGDVMVNAELVRQGYAQVATFPPNVRYVDQLRPLQQEAREAGRGCWGAAR
jgi:micrococcal nuclease